jgi:ribosome-binding protein aMBF1 (putative translation factor)
MMTGKKSPMTAKKPGPNQKRRASSFVGNIQHRSTARFGMALRERRLSLGMTQSELVEKTGLSRSYISEVECGRESISLDRAEKLARAVNSSLSELLKED